MTTNLPVLAARFASMGNLVACEIVCREILASDPLSPWALNMLGVVASRIGALEDARRYFESARDLDPKNELIRENIHVLRSARKDLTSPCDQDLFLLIKAWGCGFWSDFSHVLGCLLLSEITNRQPVTHWGENSLYADRQSIDAFRNFFEPISDLSIIELCKLKIVSFFPEKWNQKNLGEENLEKFRAAGSSDAAALYLLNREEKIVVSDFSIGVSELVAWIPPHHPMHQKSMGDVYRYLLKKFIRPRQEILQRVDHFFNSFLKGTPFVAIHLRGSDKVLESPELKEVNKRILERLVSIDPTWPIFLMTDDENLLMSTKALFGDRVISTKCQRTKSTSGVHHLDSTNSAEAGYEVLQDTLIALRAVKFIGNGHSNVSAIVPFLKDWSPNDCLLIGESILLQRNYYLHGVTGLSNRS